MTFDDILEQVIALLKRQGRVSYSALRRRFEIDEAYLNDLKDELLFAYPVTDENDRGLVWNGNTDARLETTNQPAQPKPVVEQTQPVQETSSSGAPHTPDAERRQLTVMFIDMVGSTSLSGELDPEDLRDVVREYQKVCSDVIQRYDGHVAQLLGDGLLVYFGFPSAHEDDAHRAVRTGLGIVEAIGNLNIGLEEEKSLRLAVRLGIHTGLVVVGEMGGEGRQEQLALGEAPNVAARIQGLAEPDTVVISADTYRLIQGYFACDSLGEHDLKGVSEPVPVYRVLNPSGAQNRLDITSPRGLTPLVGRESESTLLFERWAQAKDGHGQVVLLRGEAGIGKSRLVQVLKDHVADEPHAQEEYRCSPYHMNSAFYPLADLLQRKLNWQPEETADEKLRKLETVLAQTHLDVNTAVPLFTTLLSLPLPDDRYPPIQLSSQQQRQQTLEAFLQLVLFTAEQHPVLFIVEDLHWVDPSTLEFLALLIDQTPTTAIFVLLACRPEFQPTWAHRSYMIEVSLNRLSRPQVEQIATQVARGKALPADVIEQLVDKSDGVPLFVEEMTKAVLESGVLEEANGQYELSGSISSLAIPATLQDSLMARLDRLVTAKAVAQYAAVIGRQFSYELLQAVSDLDQGTLQRELIRLVEAELIYQRGLPPQATYLFKHALVVTTAYESLLKSTRQQYHQRIATVLETQFPEVTESQPELLAHHLTEAGLSKQAVSYWQKAGQQASERSAHQEAISHLTTGLSLLQTLPESLECHQLELPLQTALGAASIMVRGYSAPEVEVAYTRARLLCQQLGDTQDVSHVLLGLWRFYNTRSNFPLARQLGEELLGLAERRDESPLYVVAHLTVGATCMWMGELNSAHRHLEEGISRYTPSHQSVPMFRAGQDPGVACRAFTAWTLWLRGYPAQALACIHEARELAAELAHPFSDVFALDVACMVCQFRREAQDVYNHAEAAVTLSTEHGFTLWLAQTAYLRGWALTVLGQREKGLTQMCQRLKDLNATGAEVFTPYFLTLLAEGYCNLNRVNEGLNVLKDGLELVERMGAHFWQADVHRLQGQLLLAQSSDNCAEAESCFHQALEVSRHQQAKSLELRATTGLAKLWQSQGKREEARELLEPVYTWFSEGHDTADLIDAKTLLDELSEGQP